MAALQGEEDFHKERIKLFCRRCGNPFDHNSNDRHNPQPAAKFAKEILEIDNLDIASDNSFIHPPFLCRRCVAKIQRFKKSKNKNHPKFPGDQGKYCVFKTHNEYLVSEGTCYICSHSQRQSPRKRLGVALEENKSISEGKKARKQLFEVRPSEAGPSSSSQKTVIDHEPRTDTNSLNNVELTGIHLDRFVERDFAQIFQCTVCLDVPSNAVILAGCRHVFCEPCIRQWLTFSGVCPSCRQVTDLEDISPLKKQMLEVFELLTVKCKYSCNGCTEVIKASLLTEHEAHCKFSHTKHKKRGPYNKVKLYDISRQYAKRKRLLPMFSMLDEFCDLNNENTEDVLFSMLATTLYDNGKKELANKIEYLWVQQTDYILTADECLASRVDLLQTKNQYREQFDYLNSKGQYVFKPPNQVDSVEKTYLPSYGNYELLDGDKVIYSHKECVQEPINLMSDFRDSLPNFPTPNVVGVRWSYKDAVAKALSELNEELSEVPNDIILHALIKDGGDGLGDVSQYKEKGDRCLSDKAFRYAFCIMNVKMEDGGEMKTIWEEEAPGSVRTNRCLIESICDENQTAAMVVCVAPVEAEREEMSKSIMRIQIGSIWRNFSLRFVNSMVDEKRTRADGGLQGAGSSYLCDLCYATQKTAKSDIGTFVISRKLEETKQIADLLHFNPDKLNPSQLSAVAKGVKTHPILNIEHSEHKVDATHAKINLGKFVYKLLIREVAGVNQWEESADVKHLIQNASHKVDQHFKATIGINPCLMMPGNYARILFDPQNESKVVFLLGTEEKKNNFTELLSKLQFMHKIFSCRSPKLKYPSEWNHYKQVAVEFGNILLNNYPYARWSNYVHKCIEHVQEVIETDDTLGGLSGEGNEAGNKIFRHLRKNHSRKGSTLHSVTDVLKVHWLYCSRKLRKLSHVSRRKYKCSLCNQMGHNCMSCPAKSS